MKNINDPRSDEHKYPEGDMNANPTRPFYVDTDLSHYVARESATGRSMTKRCTFDEADYACNLLNYGWRACAKQFGAHSDAPLQACQKLLDIFESMDGESGGVSMTNEDAEILRTAIARAKGGGK